jgi:hypothetical protein
MKEVRLSAEKPLVMALLFFFRYKVAQTRKTSHAVTTPSEAVQGARLHQCVMGERAAL